MPHEPAQRQHAIDALRLAGLCRAMGPRCSVVYWFRVQASATPPGSAPHDRVERVERARGSASFFASGREQVERVEWVAPPGSAPGGGELNKSSGSTPPRERPARPSGAS